MSLSFLSRLRDTITSVNIIFRKWLLQVRLKTEDENLAEWLVDVTSEAERQGSDRYVTGYEK